MRSLLFTLAVVAVATGGCRKLTAPNTEVEPEFLGEFSGIYAGLDDRPGVESGTIVIQFRDRLVVSPYNATDSGDVRFSWFATRLDLEALSADAAARRVTPSDASILLAPRDFLGVGAGCDDTGGDPGWSYTDFVVEEMTCFDQGCNDPCFFISPIDPTDRALGDCVPNESCLFSSSGPYDLGDAGQCTTGEWCLFSGLRTGGEIDADGLTLFFDSVALMPPTRTAQPCPIDPGSGESWKACFRYPKQCEFDSRLAGVYRFELILDPSRSSLSPAESSRSLDMGVAIADNIEAAALFDGEQVFFGTFNPFTGVLAVDDGDTLDDPQIRFRDPNLLIEIDATVTEVAAANQVQVRGTWTETDGDGGVAVFDLTGVRRSGSATGRTCKEVVGCPIAPVVCPGGTATPPGTDLFFEDGVAPNGCPLQSCSRLVDRSALCPGSELNCPTLGATPVAMEGSLAVSVAYDIDVQCRDGSASCAAANSCLSVTCASSASGVGFGNLGFTDLACLDPSLGWPIFMSREELAGFVVLACLPPQPPYCSPLAPVCPLDVQLGMPSSFEPIQTEPCFEPVCWQTITPMFLCPGETFAEQCTGTDVSLVSDAGGCVSFSCVPGTKELQGVPCHAMPTSNIPPTAMLGVGLDVADLYGCPMYRPHQP